MIMGYSRPFLLIYSDEHIAVNYRDERERIPGDIDDPVSLLAIANTRQSRGNGSG